ncbi:RNA ligase family protein [Saccharothrix sp. ALI-22-I]|uniref:RNA ligase family protein n=1 Tax=Saccharothrix sp. ALI-22-I TaxID=1933778 RepID=UPI001EE6C87C|nr:RNA ligase family protein [Saccharothrix sp. ALI-22-I]
MVTEKLDGENVYARHSIVYSDLESWFYGFSVWDGDRCLDWDRTVRFLRDVGVPTPPVLWRGVSTSACCGSCASTLRGRRASSCGPSRGSSATSSGGGWPSGCGPVTCGPTRTG